MEEKLIPLSEDVEQTSQDIRDIMYQNLLTKGVEGVTPSMDVEALARLILTVPDRSGLNGWTLVPAIAVDGNRCVFKIAGWLLNNGNPPPSNVYLGYAGLVSDINEAINIRGRDGLTTSVTLNGATYTQTTGNIVLPELLPIAHNISDTAHEDIRNVIAGILAILESDDTTLDELKEIVDYIKANRSLIESITIEKISYSDIVDSLDNTSSNKPLSANMGKALDAKVETKQDKGDYATNAEVDQKISNIQLPDVGGAVGVHNTSSTSHNDIRLLIGNKQDKGNYVLTTDARLTDARNAKDVQAWAKAATKPTYTASEVGLGAVNNTSDASKPISTATQAALNLKANVDSPAFTGNMTLTGNLTLKSSGNFGNKINFGDGDYVHIYEVSDDTLEIKGTRVNLVGVVSATTAPTGTNTTQVATTAFVQNALSGGLSEADKIANRKLWDSLKGYTIVTDASSANTTYERLYLTSGNVLKATLTTTIGSNITETLAIVGGTTTTKVTTISGNIIRETIS